MRSIEYKDLTAKKNYWDSIPNEIKVRDRYRPYRYYYDDKPFTGSILDKFESGKPKYVGAFKNGYAQGFWKYYQPNNLLEQEGSFIDGYVDGEWKFYDKRGKENLKVRYTKVGKTVLADTLFTVNSEGERKEWLSNRILVKYHSGLVKYDYESDSASGRYLDERGKVIWEIKDYVLSNYVSGEKIFIINKGVNRSAYLTLLKHYTWTKEQITTFDSAYRITVYPFIEPKEHFNTLRLFNVKVEN
jgi:hypothetical protein